MTAQTSAKNRRRAAGDPIPSFHHFGVKAAAVCFRGAIAVLDAGYLAPGRTATGLICAGVFEDDVTNTGASGSKLARIRTGAFEFENSSAGDLIGVTEIGKDVFIVDDQTVAKTDGAGTRSRAGKVIKIENGKVQVLVGIGV